MSARPKLIEPYMAVFYWLPNSKNVENTYGQRPQEILIKGIFHIQNHQIFAFVMSCLPEFCGKIIFFFSFDLGAKKSQTPVCLEHAQFSSGLPQTKVFKKKFCIIIRYEPKRRAFY